MYTITFGTDVITKLISSRPRATNRDSRWQQGTLHMQDLSLDPTIQSVV